MRALPSCPPLGSACSTLLGVWNDARGDELLPARKALRPAAIAAILPITYILDYRSPDEIVYTLVGTQISESLGIEITGRNHMDLISEDERPLRRARWKLMAETPCGLYTRGRVITANGIGMPFDSVTVPMRADGGRLHFIGVSESAPGVQPIIQRDAKYWYHENIDLVAIDIGAGGPEMPRLPDRA